MKTGQIAKIAAAVLFLIVAVSFVFAALSKSADGTTLAFSGFAVAFGTKGKYTGEGADLLNETYADFLKFNDGTGSFVYLLVFILAIIGLIVALLAAFNVIKLDNKIVSFIIIGIAAVMIILCVVAWLTFFGALEEGIELKDALEALPLGFGFWLALIGSVLAAGAGVFNLLKGNE